MGTSRQPANSNTLERVSPTSPHQRYKSHIEPGRKAFPILASSSYCTHSHYLLKSSALYWNLPPLMWNLDNDSPEPPAPRKKPKRHKPKKRAPPLDHSQTHATFCRDP